MATVTSPRRTFDRTDTDRRVRHPLQALRGYIRTYVTLEGSAVAVIYLALWFWIGLGLDYGLFKITQGFDWIKELQGLSPADRTADFIVRGVILGVLVAGLLAVVALKVILRWFREFRDSALALVLERRFPRELGDRLITAVEMADPKLAAKYGFSQALIDKTIQDAAERVEQVPVKQVFNWRRLGKLACLVVALTVGMYALVGAGYLGINALLGHAASPGEYFWRFQHTASIWTERNILLMNSYWPRQSYLELVRFQDTDEHPGEMRIGRDESRPDLQVRAFQWVVADDSVSGGWRPMTWRDLPTFVDASLLGKVNIPADWGGWQMELDDLDSKVPTGVVPVALQGKTSAAIRAELATPEMRKAVANVGASQLVADWLDWQTWTLDRIANQANIDPVRRALSTEQPEAHRALDEVLAKVEELAGSVTMERQLRKLTLPEFAAEDAGKHIVFYYWGKNTKISTGPDRTGANNSFVFGLGDLKESVQFTIQALDYSTPVLSIKLVPPPGITGISIDKEEPAYLYYRLQGDQLPLKGKKQIFKMVPVSVTGETSIVQVPLGTNLTLTAEADRPLKDSVRMTRPAQTEERGAVTPVQKVELSEDQKTFSTSFKNVVKTIEFNFEFMDRDNVGGKRRIVIRPIDDRAPEVFDVEMTVGLRKPRFRAEPGKSSQGAAADGFLITPDALVPFKGTLRDDYGLTEANWHYDVEPIEFELVSKPGGKDNLPQLVLQGNTQMRRTGLVISGMQLMPGFPGTEAIYWAWVNRMVALDLAISAKRYNEEGAVPLERFQLRLEERGAEELTLNALMEKLTQKPPQRALFREHSLKDEDGFDFKKYLPKLKVADPTKEAQLHYQLRLTVSATDNNVETGPSVGKNKAPFTFLVVSESELLAQIFLEEETIRDRLDKAVAKLKNARTSVDEQLGKLSSPATDLALVNIRVEEVRKAVSDTGSTSREVHTDFSRILRELEVNRVGFTRGKQKINDVRDRIVQPLEEIINPNFGNFATSEESLSALAKGLDDHVAALRQAEADKTLDSTKAKLDANLPGHVKNAQMARDRLDSLIERLYSVYLAMEEGVVFGQLLQTIVRIEQEQREAKRRLELYHKDVVEGFLKGLIK